VYAEAFAAEVLAQDYAHSSRESLESWAQSEDAPVREPGVPRSAGAKVLVQSLDSTAMSGSTSTIIPSPEAWKTLASQQAYTTVSALRATSDPDWEMRIAAGYQPADPLMTVRQVAATLTLHTGDAEPSQRVASVAFTLAVGTASLHAGYGAMATWGYVVEAVG
jgi:hypothetical protein